MRVITLKSLTGFLSVFILLSTVSVSSLAQGILDDVPPYNWSLPAGYCETCAYTQSDEAGNLHTIYGGNAIFSPNNGSSYTEYQLPIPFGGIGAVSFIPIDPTHIVTYTPSPLMANAENQLLLIDLANGQYNTIEFFDKEIVGCRPGTLLEATWTYYMQRLGDTGLLVCSKDSVYHYDIESHHIQEIVAFSNENQSLHELARPWSRVIGGQNGLIYITTDYKYIEHLLPNINIDLYDETTIFVANQGLNASDWYVLPIPREVTTRTNLDPNPLIMGYLVAVDNVGNMYFHREDVYSANPTSDITKVNPQGDIVWRLTEDDLGSDVSFKGIINENILLLFDRSTESLVSRRVTEPNVTPIVSAGPDQTILDADSSSTESVTLDGSGSTEPDGTIVTYSWTDESGTEIATGPTPTVELPVGVHTITLTVTDDDGLTASDEVVITVTVTWDNNLLAQQQTALYELLSYESCTNACWLGIKAGETTEAELQQFLSDNGMSYESGLMGTQGDVTSYSVISNLNTPPLNNNTSIAIFVVTDGPVSAIWLPLDNVDINTVVETYGYPDRVIELRSNRSMIYVDEGILFRIVGNDRVVLANIMEPEYITQAFIEQSYSGDDIIECTDDSQLCEVVAAISETNPPTVDAGPDQTIPYMDSSGTEPVTLDGSASIDPDGTIVTYSWTDSTDTEIATGPTPTVDLSVGVHTITLSVTDDDGLTASDEVVITVTSATGCTPPNPPLVGDYGGFGSGSGDAVNPVCLFCC